MKTNPIQRILRARFWLCLALAGLLPLVLVSCSRKGPDVKPADVEYYTCTMHPSVRSQDPHGKCPICSMALVPVKKKPLAGSPGASPQMAGSEIAGMPGMPGMPGMEGGGPPPSTNSETEAAPAEFSVPVKRQQQIGVTYGKVQMLPLKRTVRTVGFIAYNRQRQWDYVARVDGYVDKLFVSSAGQVVEAGAPLLTIYSPDLLTTENEFLDVLNARDRQGSNVDPVVAESSRGLLESARRRLRLWNITDEQIAELEKTRQAQEFLTLKSPFKGVVQTLAVDQGRRVVAGTSLVQVADLSSVWVWAQFYETDIAQLKEGMPVTISAPSFPGETFPGRIAVVDPFVNDPSRTTRVRIDLDNPALKLRPGMYVNAELEIDGGNGPVLPVSAVLPTGLHDIVFVDKGQGKLEPRYVQLGRKYGEFYEVKSGLKQDERVVTSANFLIDAEAKVQGALGAW